MAPFHPDDGKAPFTFWLTHQIGKKVKFSSGMFDTEWVPGILIVE